MNTRRRGAVLLEVIVALVVLMTAGLGMLNAVAEGRMAVARVREREAELLHASRFFNAVALWSRDDLDRRLGSRRQGMWRLDIQRPADTVYDVTLMDSTGRRVILATSLFRPRSANEPR